MIADRLTNRLWAEITNRIAEMGSNDEVVRGVVIKVDANNRTINVKEFGDTAIPLVCFDYNVTYYDSTASGVVKKTAIVEVKMPHVGDLVVILKQGGARRLPLCVGIVKGKNFIAR